MNFMKADLLLVSKQSSFLKIATIRNGCVWQFFCQPLKKQSPSQDDIYLGKVVKITSQFMWLDIGDKNVGVLKRKKNEKPLLEGQKVIVQISKQETMDAVSCKGPKLTRNINLSGKFCIYHPFLKNTLFSENLSDITKQKILSIFGNHSGFTFRSSCDLLADMDLLKKETKMIEERWDLVHRHSKVGLIESAPTILERFLRDAVPEGEVIFDDVGILAAIKKNNCQFTFNSPDQFRIASLKEQPLFDFFGVQDDWTMLTESLIPLKTGGSLFIEETACVTTIDINAGDKSPEEINFQAIGPIIRQIRLRQLSGNIIIDFVRLQNEPKGRLLNEFKKQLAAENTQNIKVMGWSHLGFLELQAPRYHDSLTTYLIQKAKKSP